MCRACPSIVRAGVQQQHADTVAADTSRIAAAHRAAVRRDTAVRLSDMCRYPNVPSAACATTCAGCTAAWCDSGTAQLLVAGGNGSSAGSVATSGGFCWSGSPFGLLQTALITRVPGRGDLDLRVSCDAPPRYGQCALSGTLLLALAAVIVALLLVFIGTLIWACRVWPQRRERRQLQQPDRRARHHRMRATVPAVAHRGASRGIPLLQAAAATADEPYDDGPTPV